MGAGSISDIKSSVDGTDSMSYPVTLTNEFLPNHTHKLSGGEYSSGESGSAHTHSITMERSGSKSDSGGIKFFDRIGGSTISGSSDRRDEETGVTGKTNSASGGHTHNINVITQPSVSSSGGYTGSSQSTIKLPTYYALAFIIKVK